MRWFKHMTDAARDPKLVRLISRHGIKAYAQYFLILEVIAAEMDETNQCEVTLSVEYLANLIETKPSHVGQVMLTLSELVDYVIDTKASLVTLRCQNLLKIRARKNPIESKSCHLDIEVEVDKEEKKINKEKPRAQAKLSPADYFSKIPEDKIRTWEKTFPQKPVRQELLHMQAWLIANPSRWKTNYDRFVVNWLGKPSLGFQKPESTWPSGPVREIA